MKVGDLFMELGVRDKLSKPLKSAGTHMKSLRKSALLGTTAVLGLGVAFGALTSKSFGLSNSLSSFETSTGLSAQKLQKFSQIAELAGSNSQDLKASIEGIQQAKAKINMGEGNLKSWKMLKIDPKDDPFTILEELRNKIKNVQNPEDLARIKEFMSGTGISKGLLPMLKLSDQQMKKFSNNTFILDKKQVKNLDKARVAVKTFTNEIGYLKNVVISNLAPYITQIAEAFKDWLGKHKEEFIATIKSIGKWLLKLIKNIPNLIEKIDNIVKSMGGWKAILLGLGIAFGALKLAPLIGLLNPFTIALGAVAFIIKELVGYAKGDNNLFAQWAKDMPEFKKLLDGVVNTFKILKALFFGNDKALATLAKKFPNLTKVVTAFWATGQGVFTAFKDILSIIVHGFTGLGKVIGIIWDMVSGKKGVFEGLKDLGKVYKTEGLLALKEATTNNTNYANNVMHKASVINNVTMNLNGDTSNARSAEEMGDHIAKRLARASS